MSVYGSSYIGTFSDFGNKALALGATAEDIQETFDATVIPDKYTAKLTQHGGKK